MRFGITISQSDPGFSMSAHLGRSWSKPLPTTACTVYVFPCGAATEETSGALKSWGKHGKTIDLCGFLNLTRHFFGVRFTVYPFMDSWFRFQGCDHQCIFRSGWWYSYPSEKHESVGIMIPNIWMKKKDVPNHHTVSHFGERAELGRTLPVLGVNLPCSKPPISSKPPTRYVMSKIRGNMITHYIGKSDRESES